MSERLSTLFEPPPVRYGLRGDAILWAELARWLDAQARPRTALEFERLIGQGFAVLTGHALEPSPPFWVERFDRGGLSSGKIDPNFWRDTALPLLTGRFRARFEHGDAPGN